MFAGVVLGVGVVGEALAAGLLGEGECLIAGHYAADSDEVRRAACGREEFRVQVRVLLCDGIDLLLRLILMVVGEGNDAPLIPAA